MNKIGIKELFSLTLCLSIAFFSLFGTALILDYGKNSSIFSCLAGMIIGFIPLGMILYISKFLENKTIFQINKEKFKLFGEILNILYVICITFIGFVISWNIIKFTITQLLIRSSYYFVGFFLFAIIGFAVTKGVEVIGRSTVILNIISLLTLAFVLILLIPKIEINNLFPIFNVSTKKFIQCSLLLPTFTVYPLISLLCIKKNDIDKPEKFNKYVILAYIFAIVIVAILIFYILSVYGIEFSSMFTYPEYYLYKKVEAFEFISRIENIVAIINYIAYFGNICMLITFVKTYLKEKFNIKKERTNNIIVYFLAISVPMLSIYVFQNYHPYKLTEYYPIFSSAILVILVINFILLLFSKKRS